MKFSIQREDILKPLQAICGVVERRQTMPVLSNVLMTVSQSRLVLCGTDLEVELKIEVPIDSSESGEITLPARKLFDICRALPEDAEIHFQIEGDRATLRSGKSRFTLSTLPATEFPSMEAIQAVNQFVIPQSKLKYLIDKTQFCMAQQDVRYYLNGLMLEIDKNRVCAVATDGHRLAWCQTEALIDVPQLQQIIIPRKGINELSRLLENNDTDISLRLSTNHIRVSLPNITFTSKLIDGRFPDYQRVMPQSGDKIVYANREVIRQALVRASILSNEKYRGIRMTLQSGMIQVQANNPELEEAEEEFPVEYTGPGLEIGFNVTYFLDALSVIDQADVSLQFADSNSSCLITPKGDKTCKYVVMPMRL
ncbi:MAG: DNA polymerase III subunit beta [Pseudomonadota bacterium]